MKTIIAGSRNIAEYTTVEAGIDQLPLIITEVVSGTARGVDRLGEQWAEKNNIPVKKFPANWDKYGKRAGYLRNAEMAEYADALVAFWDGESKGTEHMINLAKKAGLVVRVVMVGEE